MARNGIQDRCKRVRRKRQPKARPLVEAIDELMAGVPDEALAAVPTDLAVQHDHYLYGTPKVRDEPLTIDITEARRDLNSMGKRLASEPVIYVTRHGKKAFAFVDADHIAVMLETIEIMSNHVGYKSFQQSLRDLREGRLHDHDDVAKELG